MLWVVLWYCLWRCNGLFGCRLRLIGGCSHHVASNNEHSVDGYGNSTALSRRSGLQEADGLC